ncbi:MAG: hypothetical protein ACOC0Q_08140 [Wenzhouxiangella sp.]
MSILADHSSMTTAEVDAVLTATNTSRLINGKNKVAHLGNVKTPSLNRSRKMQQRIASPVRGGYKCFMSGQRGQKMQSISGRDIHTFKSVDTLFDLEYKVGRVHLGDEWVHQQLEEAGISIDYTQAYQTVDVSTRGWWKHGDNAFEVAVNLADQKLQALELNYVQELNKLFWRDNATDPKLWPGVDSLLPRSGNTSGPVGNRTRANPLLRHQLEAIGNIDDAELVLSQLRRKCNKRIHDGTTVDFLPVGEALYDAIVAKIFSGKNGAVGTTLVRNIDNARSEAQAMAQRIGIGIPDDAIYLAGVGLLMIEPVFEELDAEDNPAITWQKSGFFINSNHFQFIPTKKKDGHKKVHPTPYNQLVTRISCYGEYALVADQLDCHGVTYAP